MDKTFRPRLNVPVRPFPWRQLEAIPGERGGLVRAFARALHAVVDLPAAQRRLEAITGQRASVRLLRLEPGARVTSGTAQDGLPGPVRDVGAHLVAEGAIVHVEVELELATRLVAAALGRAAPFSGQRAVIAAPLRLAGPEIAEAFAALLMTGARAASPAAMTRAPLRLAAIGAAGAPRGGDASITATYVVTLGMLGPLASPAGDGADETFLAYVSLPRAQIEQARPPTFARATLRTLGDVVLALPLVAAVSSASPAELSSLAIGDAWVPDAWSLTRTSAGGWSGPVLLAAGDVEEAVRAELTADGRLVLGGDVETLAWTAEPNQPRHLLRSLDDPPETDAMNDRSPAPSSTPSSDSPDALVASLAETPVIVRVEIGVVELRAREWAELAPGDVIGVGRRVGEPVILRAAGREIARGELVDLDGEVGVRVLSRMEIES